MDKYKAILGIHVLKQHEHPGLNHAWVTLEKDGVTSSYSSFPPTILKTYPKMGKDRLPGSDVYKNVELDQSSTTSLYAELTPSQAAFVEREMNRPQQYDKRRNNCCHLAVAAYEVGREEKLHATDPRAPDAAIPDVLEETIRKRNLQPDEHRTINDSPQSKPQLEVNQSQADSKSKPSNAQSRRERLIEQSRQSREAQSQEPNQNDGPKRRR